jgi:hypothetical protein
MGACKVLVLSATFLLAGGCRGGGETGEVKPKPPRDAAAGEPADDAQGAGGGAASQEAGAQKVCPADMARREADLKRREERMAEVLRKIKLGPVLLDFVDEVAAAAGKKDLERLEAITLEYWGYLKQLREGVSEDDARLIGNVVKARVEGYTTCMAVAEKSAAWCSFVESGRKTGVNKCLATYDVFVLAYGGAVKGGKPCKAAMKGARTMGKEESVAFCDAIVAAQPEKCPWGEKTPQGAYCRAAASRGKLGYCKKVEGSWSEKQETCCNLFAWRFSGLFSGKSQSMGIPEAEAVRGESAGCMNALKWGLFENLASLFGVEFPFEPAAKEELFGEILCPMEIHWSGRAMITSP